MNIPNKASEQVVLELQLIGVFRPRPQAPGFAIPLFSHDGTLCVQEISHNDEEQEVVTGFAPCDVENSHVFEAPQRLKQRVGNAPLFAFRFPNGTLSIGPRSVVQNAIRASWSQLENHAFVLWDCAEFLQDVQLQNEARTRAEKLLASSQLPQAQTLPAVETTSGRLKKSQEPEYSLLREHIKKISNIFKTTAKEVIEVVNPVPELILNASRHSVDAWFLLDTSTVSCKVVIIEPKIQNHSFKDIFASELQSYQPKKHLSAQCILWDCDNSSGVAGTDTGYWELTEMSGSVPALHGIDDFTPLYKFGVSSSLDEQIHGSSEALSWLQPCTSGGQDTSNLDRTKQNCLVVFTIEPMQRPNQPSSLLACMAIRDVFNNTKHRHTSPFQGRNNLEAIISVKNYLKDSCLVVLDQLDERLATEMNQER